MEVLRKHNAPAVIYFPLVSRDLADFNETPATFASGDTKISKDGAALANATNNPTHVGGGLYALTLTSTEMAAGKVVVLIKDQGTKLWEDQCILINTYGHASAGIVFDLSTAIQQVDVTKWLTVTPSALASGRVDVTVGVVQTDAITAASIAANALGTSEVASAVINAIADQVWDEARSGHTTAGSYGQNVLADIVAVNGTAQNAVNMAAGALSMVIGSAITGTLSTTQMTTNLTETTNDHYVGRNIYWTSGVLVGQARKITAYNGTSKLLTFDTATDAPTNGMTFVII